MKTVEFLPSSRRVRLGVSYEGLSLHAAKLLAGPWALLWVRRRLSHGQEDQGRLRMHCLWSPIFLFCQCPPDFAVKLNAPNASMGVSEWKSLLPWERIRATCMHANNHTYWGPSVPGSTVPHILYTRFPVNPAIPTREACNHYPCFIDEETETQRGDLSQDPSHPAK